MLGNRFIAAALVAATLSIYPAIARAGGFDELPDQGAQALGRGATFTAKADDATALYWNVAGLARQRGTKLQVSANLHLNTFYFARAGNYPDNPADPATPWGGKPFPVVSDRNLSFVLPMLVATTDFGVFDRLTFGVGIFGPSATGRTFQIGVNGLPAPSRYDFVQSSSAVMFPTFGAAYRLTPQIDIGVSGHFVLADFNELQISYVDTGSCKNAEYHPCDVEGGLEAKGGALAGSIGILARPAPSVQLGAQVRSASSVKADGQVTTKLAGAKPSPASVTLDLPWIVRLGARYISLDKKTKFEEYDLEIDGTYETWGSAQSEGPTVTTTDLTGVSTKPTSITSVHKWNDTFSSAAHTTFRLAQHAMHAMGGSSPYVEAGSTTAQRQTTHSRASMPTRWRRSLAPRASGTRSARSR
jgi:long-chain fatty acid transport protein